MLFRVHGCVHVGHVLVARLAAGKADEPTLGAVTARLDTTGPTPGELALFATGGRLLLEQPIPGGVPFDRARYAGPVGWVDANGDGEWVVGIRSAQLDGRRARLFAGCGIVAGSDPAAELGESDAKLVPMRDALSA